MSYLFANLQRILPQHLLSRIVAMLARSEAAFIKFPFIHIFCLFFNVNLKEAERGTAAEYRSFNDFFTRSLKEGLRPVSGRICSPADGRVAALGRITGSTLIQSKNIDYSLQKLLADEGVGEFSEGSFITIYLAPHNYHRVHAPCRGELSRADYIPGSLFSVNNATATHIPDLFAINERLILRFTSAVGPMAYVMVGAMLVAGIKPVWADKPYKPGLQVKTALRRQFEQGEEIGHFEMGSTVILIFDHEVDFLVKAGQSVQFGEAIA